MAKRAKVSVWIGEITSEDDLICYVDDGEFARDFDFEYSGRGTREMAAERQPVAVSKLVEGFSHWEHFAAKLIACASEIGFRQASSLLIIYAFEYMPSASVNPNSKLKFIGTFDF